MSYKFLSNSSLRIRRASNAKLALVLAALLGVVGCSRVSSSANEVQTASVLPAANATSLPAVAGQTSYADVVARVAPAVVTVRYERR